MLGVGNGDQSRLIRVPELMMTAFDSCQLPSVLCQALDDFFAIHGFIIHTIHIISRQIGGILGLLGTIEKNLIMEHYLSNL